MFHSDALGFGFTSDSDAHKLRLMYRGADHTRDLTEAIVHTVCVLFAVFVIVFYVRFCIFVYYSRCSQLLFVLLSISVVVTEVVC